MRDHIGDIDDFDLEDIYRDCTELPTGDWDLGARENTIDGEYDSGLEPKSDFTKRLARRCPR
jgi:hypothetical protein